MSSTPFGEHLKRERELRGVSLEEIAAATRIKTGFLEALESGRWNELPGGAFNRGFVRATARFLGLDEDGMVAEFALETAGESQAKPPARPSGSMPRDYRPALAAASAFLLLLIAGGWFAHHEISVRRQKRAAAAIAASAAISVPPVAAPAANSATPIVPAPIAPPDANANPQPLASLPITHPEPAASEPLKLHLETSKTTQIRVTGDGKLQFKGRLHSDDPMDFQARDGFEVASNDSGAVKLQLNGKTIPFDGTPGRHGSISLSRKDLKSPADSTP
jgi:cytoskeleton protein RodZ